MRQDSTPAALVLGCVWCLATALAVVPSAAAETPGQSVVAGTAAPADDTPTVLKYGDGKADGRKSYGGRGPMICFTLPEGVSEVRGLRIHASRYGHPQAPDEEVDISFLSQDLQEILDSRAAHYRLFKRGNNKWTRVLFDRPVELPREFWIAFDFHAEQTKGVYVSYDTSTGGQYSRVGLAGEDEVHQTDFGGDWMVQVLVSRPGP